MNILSRIYDSTVRSNKRTGGGRNRWIKDSSSLDIEKYVEGDVKGYIDNMLEMGYDIPDISDLCYEIYERAKNDDVWEGYEDELKDMVFANVSAIGRYDYNYDTGLFGSYLCEEDWKSAFMYEYDCVLGDVLYCYLEDHKDELDLHNRKLRAQQDKEFLEDSKKALRKQDSRIFSARGRRVQDSSYSDVEAKAKEIVGNLQQSGEDFDNYFYNNVNVDEDLLFDVKSEEEAIAYIKTYSDDIYLLKNYVLGSERYVGDCFIREGFIRFAECLMQAQLCYALEYNYDSYVSDSRRPSRLSRPRIRDNRGLRRTSRRPFRRR